jgi:hypothetical protein
MDGHATRWYAWFCDGLEAVVWRQFLRKTPMSLPSPDPRHLLSTLFHHRLCQRTLFVMPDIEVGSQIFDLTFHPSESLVYTGLLTGDVKAFGYDEQGQHEEKFTLKPSRRSCRGLAISDDGSQLWAVGKGKAV